MRDHGRSLDAQVVEQSFEVLREGGATFGFGFIIGQPEAARWVYCESCNGTFCFSSERERPGYRMGLHNDINWCMANASQGYHCTVAVLVGMADA